MNNSVVSLAFDGTNLYAGGGFTSPSFYFAIYNRGSVLPVQLLSFSGKNTKSGNVLSWQTASELNNKGFQIERLTASGNWLSIGFISGNNTASTYEFVDNAPLTIAFYRLRQIDVDGRSKLSEIVKLLMPKNNLISLYPVPASTNVMVTVPQNLVTTNAVLLDNGGRQIKTILLTNTVNTIDVSTLPSGVYILRFADGSTSKIVKE